MPKDIWDSAAQPENEASEVSMLQQGGPPMAKPAGDVDPLITIPDVEVI